jgi:hypothetical protein
MDINTLAAYGEFLGGIAVVVSLVYLASQIRQNSKLLRVSATAAVFDSDHSIQTTMLHDPLLARLWSTDTATFKSLPEADRFKLTQFFGIQASICYRNYYLALDGVLREAVWASEKRGFSLLLKHAWIQHSWSEMGLSFSEEFGEFVKGLIREGEDAGRTSN